MSETLSAPEFRRRQLVRMKRWALVLLLMMVAGFVTSHLMGGQGAWAWVRAFCEAATVGALADWFAVVALFRRPLGLPIPHTAIIPNSKDRIGENLAVFVRDHFLDPDTLLDRLRVFDPAARLARWLARPAQARALAQARARPPCRCSNCWTNRPCGGPSATLSKTRCAAGTPPRPPANS